MELPILKKFVEGQHETISEAEWEIAFNNYLSTEEGMVDYIIKRKECDYLERELNEVEKYLDISNRELQKIRELLNRNKYEEANEQTFNLVRLTEKITENARKIPLQLTRPGSKKRLFDEIAERADVSVEQIENNYIKIVLGRMLPKRFTTEGAVNYLWSTYHSAFNNFYLQNKLNYSLDKVYIIYIHSYDCSQPRKAYRDNDNIETNAITDIIVEYLLKDDNPHICKQLNLVKKAKVVEEIDKTIIYLVPQHLFLDFYKNYLQDD